MDGTVLVADDDRTIRTVLTQALTRAGRALGFALASVFTIFDVFPIKTSGVCTFWSFKIFVAASR